MSYCDEEEEEREGISGTEKTARVLKQMMNSVFTNLRFTVETAEDFKDAALPTLDTKVWIEGGRLLYTYFEKPMANKKVMARKSAMGENMKIASLSQDLVRRMKNTSSRLPQSSRNEVVNQYTIKLASSGYSLDQVHRIVVAGLRGFEKKVKKQLAGKGLIHQSAAGGAAKRNRKKLLDRTNWFRGKKQDQEEGEEKEHIEQNHHHKETRKEQRNNITDMSSSKEVKTMRTSSVLFVEQTPRGELARRFREAEKGLSRLTGFS